MEFKITKASDYEFVEHRTFSTIEEIRDFVLSENKKSHSCVIYWDDMELLIYDDWIE